jgi:hypothetical protein
MTAVAHTARLIPDSCCARISLTPSAGSSFSCDGNSLTLTVRTTDNAGNATFGVGPSSNQDVAVLNTKGFNAYTCSNRSTATWGLVDASTLQVGVTPGANGSCSTATCSGANYQPNAAWASGALAVAGRHSCLIYASDGGVACSGFNQVIIAGRRSNQGHRPRSGGSGMPSTISGAKQRAQPARPCMPPELPASLALQLLETLLRLAAQHELHQTAFLSRPCPRARPSFVVGCPRRRI